MPAAGFYAYRALVLSITAPFCVGWAGIRLCMEWLNVMKVKSIIKKYI